MHSSKILGWIAEHPELVVGAITALITLLARPLDPAGEAAFRARSPRLFALRELVRALGLDSPKAAKASYTLVTRKPWPFHDRDDKK